MASEPAIPDQAPPNLARAVVYSALALVALNQLWALGSSMRGSSMRGSSMREGAARKFNLDFYCKAFGIESPKAHGVTGMDVTTLMAAGNLPVGVQVIAPYGSDAKALAAARFVEQALQR